MQNSDGLSQEKRSERISAPAPLSVTDNSMASLLRRAEAIAGFIRYYNFQNQPDGYFDELLPELRKWIPLYLRNERPPFDGNTEPSQALLLTFLYQLHRITEQFNKRWEQLPYWYLNEVLGVENLPARPDKLRISFRSGFRQGFSLKKEMKFVFGTDPGEGSVYRLQEAITVEPASLTRTLALLYRKDPARTLYGLAIAADKAPGSAQRAERLFPERPPAGCMQSPGFILSSISLLLREGKRSVTVRFESETPALADFIGDTRKAPASPLTGKTEEEIADKILNNIFQLQISTPEGWHPIEHYHVEYGGQLCNNQLVLKFTLPESFPPVSGCTDELHGTDTKHPALKVELNSDAWLYPYSWIRNIRLKRIVINTQSEGISGLLLYNELGRIDPSKPFAPFGINTERGAWIAVGNYEMAIKNSRSMDLHIQWGELPDTESGLSGHYAGYGEAIDNLSFRVKTGYLRNYQWETDSQLPLQPLFDTAGKSGDGLPLKQAPLIGKSVLGKIDISPMPPVNCDEELYDYNIRTRDGFACLILTDPPMGFGEQRYRQLFTEQMMQRIARKKESALLNPPIRPRIERITLNYRSEESIEFGRTASGERHEFRHLFPLGVKKVYPQNGGQPVPLIYSMEHDAHILLGLQEVRGGTRLRFYFDFVPMRLEIQPEEYPVLAWFWGDGYTWETLPDGVISRDTTRNFFVSGEVIFDLPEPLPDHCYDDSDVFWLRAAVVKGWECIAGLSGIHLNAAELIRNQDERISAPGLEKGVVRPVNETAGLGTIEIISASRREHTAENDRKKLIRVSEYVSHRGKAVTPRDFERMVLQAFPQVGKIKCFSAAEVSPGGEKGIVTLVVVPRRAISGEKKGWRPQASSGLLADIESYLREYCSAAVLNIDAINPLYEEVFLRCRLKFKPGYSLGGCRSELWELCNDIIAPWQKKRSLPVFGYRLQLSKLRHVIRSRECIDELEFLSLIRIAKTGRDEYRIDEYSRDEDLLTPSVPQAVFIPARHIFNCEKPETFGLGEMVIGETCILDHKNRTNSDTHHV